MLPLSNSCWMIISKEKGEMFSSVASLAPTLSPGFISCTSLRISKVLLEILVALKKEVFLGPRPVFWAGTVASHGAMAPAQAAAGTLLASSMSLISVRFSLVNTKPTFPQIWGSSFSRAGWSSRCHRMAFFIMVFLPISTTVFLCGDIWICCIHLEPTLSAPTVKHFG